MICIINIYHYYDIPADTTSCKYLRNVRYTLNNRERNNETPVEDIVKRSVNRKLMEYIVWI